jgi:hypothetical protein
VHEREFTALSRWIAEYGGRDDADELAPLARRLDQLLRTDEGDEERNWQQLARSAERLSSRGEIARVRAGSRGLVALLRGDHAAISAFVTEHSIAERPPHDDRTGRSWGSPSSRQLRIAALVATTSVVLLAGGVELAKALTTPALTVTGPAHDAQIGAPRVDSIAFVARGTARELGKERWVLDGRNVDKDVVTKPGEFVFRPNDLIEGVHELEVSLGGGFLGASAHKRFKFVVDLTPPSLQVTRSAKGISWQPIEVHGTAEEGSSVKVDGKSVALEHGDFSARVQPPVPARVSVVATDPAGNTARSFVSVTLVPRHVVEPIRAVHLTADAWANSELRGQALKLIAQHRVNTIELDLKDEGGIVGFSGVAAANRMGATRPIYNLAAAVNELHAMGVRVIGRLVCFSDPLAASVLWRTGHRDEVVQTPDHKPYAGYGGFTNFANPTVRRYEISIAVAAAKDGVDDVLYDYVRRPDGPISSMVFPGLKGSPSAAIVEFLRETKIALRPYHTYLGASVFGIAATRPDQVAQDIPAMARDLDYVSPMVYPSHWNNGEYDVADPNEEPYLIVKRSLVDFKHDVAGSGARLVPWLQDFSLGVTYGPAQVRAQIAAARSDGVNEFLLWNAGAVYDAGGLAPDAPRAAPLKPADG